MGLEVASDDEDEKQEKRPPRSKVIAAAREEDIREVLDWMHAQGSEASFRITVARKWPLVGPGGENIGGTLDTLEERPEDLNKYIAERWGGGSFDVKVEVPSNKRQGGWDYARRGTLKLAGDPKLDPKLHASARASTVTAAPERDTLAEMAFRSAQQQAQEDRRRADELARELRDRPSGADPQMINTLLAQIAGMQQQLVSMAAKEPPKDEFRDAILKQAVAGESQRLQDQARMYETRIDKMRDDHTAEVRLLSINHTDAMKRAEDRHDKAMEQTQRTHERTVSALEKSKDEAVRDLRDAHTREIKNQDKSQDQGSKMLETAHLTRVESLQSENKRLQGEITALKSEVGALREKKEKSPHDQIKELAAMKEGFDSLTGGGGGDDTWYSKLAGALANSEGVLALVDKIGGGSEKDEEEAPAEQPAQAAPQQLPPVGAFFRHPQDGKLYRHLDGGQFEGPVDEQKVKALALANRKLRAQQARAAARAVTAPAAAAQAEPEGDALDAAIAEAEVDNGIDNGLPRAPQRAAPNPAAQATIVTAPAPAAPRAKPQGKPPTADQIKTAVEMMEAAFRAKTDPAMMARSAKSLMDGATLAHIQNVGVDNFLTVVAKMRPGSPLVTQHGRGFVREVARHLFGPPT